MAKQPRKFCPQCRRLQQQFDAQATQLKALQDQVTHLQEKLAAVRKTSATSSKPPSSDLVKPARPNADDPNAPPRQSGGQLGHAKYQRELFPPEQVTRFVEHQLQACPCCSGTLRRNGSFQQVVQQIDVAAVPLTIEQDPGREVPDDVAGRTGAGLW